MRKEVYVLEFHSNICDHSETGVFLRRLNLIFNVCGVMNKFLTVILICPRLGTWITAHRGTRQLYLRVAIFVLALQFRNNHEDCNTRLDMCTEMWNFGIAKFPCQLLLILKMLKFLRFWITNFAHGGHVAPNVWTVSMLVCEFWLNILAPEFYFLILTHSVYRILIIQEPNTFELWNKLHLEEKKTESIYHT